MRIAFKPLLLSLAMTLGAASPAWADHEPADATPNSAASASDMAEGVIKKVDSDQGKLTIQHGPIDSLGMPPMTMRFKVGDPAQLTAVKPGDKIRFQVEKKDGAFVVQQLELTP